MELSIRDWMVVIGVLLLLAVGLDGYRRSQIERKNRVRVSKAAKRRAKQSKPGKAKQEQCKARLSQAR